MLIGVIHVVNHLLVWSIYMEFPIGNGEVGYGQKKFGASLGALNFEKSRSCMFQVLKSLKF